MPVSVVVIMGPAGAGKTTVGVALAAALGWRFADADDFHSPENVARLARGDALTDEQRAPWLAALAADIARTIAARSPMVLACSALKRRYRDRLVPVGDAAEAVRFVYLKVSTAELEDRLEHRTGHFATEALLPSQLATLEEPALDEPGTLWVDGEQPPTTIVSTIRSALAL